MFGMLLTKFGIYKTLFHTDGLIFAGRTLLLVVLLQSNQFVVMCIDGFGFQ